MKRIFLFFFFAIVACLFSQKSFAQGNLQFNQVLTYGGNMTGSQSSAQWTVPSGKAWKIEKLLDGNGTSQLYFNVNGTNYKMSSTYGIGQSIWLKAGDVVQFQGYGGAGPYAYFLSIIEFNIIP